MWWSLWQNSSTPSGKQNRPHRFPVRSFLCGVDFRKPLSSAGMDCAILKPAEEDILVLQIRKGVINMKEKLNDIISVIWEFLHWSFAPVILFVLMLIEEAVLHDMGAFGLKTVCTVVLAAGMVLSFVLCFHEYEKAGKWILIVLCIFSVVNAYSDIERMDDAPEAGALYHDGISFTGNRCTGCGGRGYITCNSAFCVKGNCTRCDHGLYDNGSYWSECRVCGGDGKCNRCYGTGKVDCRVCR